MSWQEKLLGTKFEEARNIIQTFINKPLPKGVHTSVTHNLEGIKQLLNNQFSHYKPSSAIPRFE